MARHRTKKDEPRIFWLSLGLCLSRWQKPLVSLSHGRIRTRCPDTSPSSSLWMKSTRRGSFSVHRWEKTPGSKYRKTKEVPGNISFLVSRVGVEEQRRLRVDSLEIYNSVDSKNWFNNQYLRAQSHQKQPHNTQHPKGQEPQGLPGPTCALQTSRGAAEMWEEVVLLGEFHWTSLLSLQAIWAIPVFTQPHPRTQPPRHEQRLTPPCTTLVKQHALASLWRENVLTLWFSLIF